MACPSIILRFSSFLCGFWFIQGQSICAETIVANKGTGLGTGSNAVPGLLLTVIGVVLLIVCVGCSTTENVDSLEWYREAAEKGYPEAQFNLGVLYANGLLFFSYLLFFSHPSVGPSTTIGI